MKGYIEPQWKGTTICADWSCPACDTRQHIDKDYLFHWTIECEGCGRWFALSPRVEMVEVHDEHGGEDGTFAYVLSEEAFPIRPSDEAAQA